MKTSDNERYDTFFIVLGDINLFMNVDISLSRICEISFPGLHRRAFISSFLVPLDPHPTFRYRYESKLESPAKEMSALSSKYEAPSWLMAKTVGSFFFFFFRYSFSLSRKDVLDYLPWRKLIFTTACFRSSHLHYKVSKDTRVFDKIYDTVYFQVTFIVLEKRNFKNSENWQLGSKFLI